MSVKEWSWGEPMSEVTSPRDLLAAAIHESACIGHAGEPGTQYCERTRDAIEATPSGALLLARIGETEALREALVDTVAPMLFALEMRHRSIEDWPKRPRLHKRYRAEARRLLDAARAAPDAGLQEERAALREHVWLTDPLSEFWRSLECAIWPDGPASGHGSGTFAVCRDVLIDRIRSLEAAT